MRKTNTRFSCKVQAVVTWYGPLENFIKMDEELTASGMGAPDHSNEDSPESQLLGRKITDVPALVKYASPMTYIKPSVPPFLVQHGLKDSIVPVEQSIHFAAQMEKIAGRDHVILDTLKNADHGDPLFEKPQNLKRVFDFFDLHLK
jgi:dipeptidyl aminopeptidase/acylaminoacyl peptidase